MPLLDHFRPPLRNRPGWQTVHGTWIHYLMRSLNRSLLPPGYRAVRESKFNGVEVDVGLVREPQAVYETTPVAASTCAGYRIPPYDADAAGVVSPYGRVLVFREDGDARLVGAIELVSPGNKDRPEERKAFAAKMQTYIQSGVSLIVADIVTVPSANLNNVWAAEFGSGEGCLLAPEDATYASAYRPYHAGHDPRVQMWMRPVAVGELLPTLPLFIDANQAVPIDLDTTYAEACEDIRLDAVPVPA